MYNQEEYLSENEYSYSDLALIYCKLKAATDSIKDFQQAGWFYFNEYEMKRQALIDEHLGKLNDNVLVSETTFDLILYYLKCLFSKRPIYYLYKVFAGYCEKPLWSFIWFCIFTVIFTGLNFLSGLSVRNFEQKININVNFDISLTLDGIKVLATAGFWNHLSNSFMFTLYRIIQVNYLPFVRSNLEPLGLDGLLLSFLNSIVLILMVVFISIGLKRHFRRF